MVNPILPKAQSLLADKGGFTTREWYEFFRRLLQFVLESGADPGVIQSILDRLDELEQNGNNFSIQGLMSVDVFGTPAGGVVQIQLEGDVQAPGNTYYYGTGPTGVKGFFTVASALAEGVNIDLITGLDGVTAIAMPAAGDGSTARKPIQYNADALDTLGADSGFTYDPTVGVKLLENEGPASFRAITDTATLGSELVTNGTFTGSAAGWALGAGWAYVSNNVVFTVGGAGTLSQSVNVVSGQRYRLAWTQQHSVVNSASITPSLGAAVGITTSYNNTGANTQEQIITALATGAVTLTFTPASILGGGTVTIDSVSLMDISTIPSVIEGENVSGVSATEIRSFSGTTNQAFGLESGKSITSGADNAFLGNLAGGDVTSGSSNTLVGPQAGSKLTTGSGNTIVGRFAGAGATTGSNNTLIGIRAGQSMVTGSDVTFVGRDAGMSNTGGTSNTFIGSVAGSANTIGTSNVFIGLASGNQNTTGNNLVAVGRDAGFNNTTLNNNNYIGSMAGRNNSTGVNSNFFGTNSGQFLADGTTANTGPTQCLYLGGGTRSLSATDTNSIVVGHGSIGRGSNTAQWGNTSILNHYFSGSINLNQTSLADLGAGVFRMLNATTVPSVNPVNGVVIYSEGGAAKCRGAGGTTTTFGPAAPHCNKCGSDFVHEWENESRGYGYLAVCMNCYADGVRSVTRVKGSWPEPD